MAKGSESKVGDGTRPKSYGHDPILSAQQGGQFAALTGNYSDPAFLTALRNRFNGDAGGYSGRNDLLQQANMAQLVGNQNAYQEQAQKASAIRDSQEARQTQQRNKGISERAVANKIGGASADELNRSKQFQQALALRLKQDPTASGAIPPPPPPAAAPPEPVAPTAPTQDQILQEALARQRASSGSHRNDSSPWYFMPGAKGGPPLAPSAPAVPPESAAPAAPTQDQIRQEALARQRASSGSHRNDSSPWYFMPGKPGGPPL